MSHAVFRKNNVLREVKVGYSWTVFFFGPFPFMFRGQWGWAALAFLLCFLTYGLAGPFIGFFANRSTARFLAENGWTPLNLHVIPDHWGIGYGESHESS